MMARPSRRQFLAVPPLLAAACRGGGPLGVPDSYLLLAPDAGAAGPLQHVRTLDVAAPEAAPLVRAFAEGFAAELLRTVYIAKQYVREAGGGHAYSEAGRALAGDTLPVVVGVDRAPYGRGLAVARWLGGADERPALVWLGLGGDLERDRALVQTLAARLSTYVLHLVASGGTFDGVPAMVPAVLGDGYRMAMEVIAREWRTGRGAQGVVPFDAGTEAQRALFASVRDNRFVLPRAGEPPRPARELLADAGVAATVLYQLAQSKSIARHAAPDAFYAPFAPGRVPPGISPAAALGAFRNFQAKLLGSWGAAIKAGHPPRDVVDLVETYASAFPDEREAVITVFLTVTFGATVKPGVPTAPARAGETLAALQGLARDVVAGRLSLRGMTSP